MNRLRYETSPYLLQHADNPVDWYPWAPEALEKAKAENKPILVSIGYATCHWCHVMERESFQDADIAAFMNHHFVNIKIDREERPDLDQLYMEAGHLLNRTNGWPLNCFLTPEGKPFFAGSYFPPEPGPKQMAWFQALQYALYNFRENRDAVERQADRIVKALEQQNREEAPPPTPGAFFENPFPPELTDRAFEQLRQRFDPKDGGFGDAPKFPDLPQLRFLLHYYYFTRQQDSLDHLLLSLERMTRGGIYDLVGGGLARYATDRAWKIPHFEKMLYDNALFARLLADVYSLTREARWKERLEETLQFMRRELSSEEGAFYSGLDAESEGAEGKYYTWTYAELEQVLPPDLLQAAGQLFDISREGNWEDTNILHLKREPAETESPLYRQILGMLAGARAARPKPRRDTKILLGWNALTVAALARGYEATRHAAYREDAIRLMQYLLRTFPTDDGQALYRVAAQGQVHHPALLQDYAFFIQALIATYRITWDIFWLKEALEWAGKAMEQFADPDGALFFLNPSWQRDLLVRTKETHDLEMPSGNSAFMEVLHQLGLLWSRPDLRERAANMLLVLKSDLEASPQAYGNWLCQWLTEAYGANEVVLIGEKAIEWANEMRSRFIPNAVLLPSKTESDQIPLWEGRPALDPTGIYVCQEQACMRPVNDLEAALLLIHTTL